MISSDKPVRRVNPFEKGLFEIFCVFLLALGLYGFALNFFFGGFKWISIPVFLLGITAGVFGYLSKTQNKFHQLRIPLVVMLSLFIAYYWFFLGGYSGPMVYIIILFGSICLIIIPRKLRRIFLWAYFSLLTILILAQYHTDWVETWKFSLTDFPLEVLVFMYAILMSISLLKAQFDKERNQVLQQNKELEDLNNSLKKSLREKEEAIGELNSTRDRLISSEKMASLGKLTAGIAHELNNPLNYIGGSVEPIRRDLEDLRKLVSAGHSTDSDQIFDELDLLLGNIKQGADKAGGIIHSLVKQSPKADLETNSFEIFDFTKTIETATKMFQRTHPEVVFEMAIPNQLSVYGNRQELSQVLNNVLQNATNSLRSGVQSRITLKASVRDNSVVLNIADNGVGIPKSDLSHVFEPFFTTQQSENAAGLGLFISYGIIKKHSGEIRIESDADGTVVSIFLPTA